MAEYSTTDFAVQTGAATGAPTETLARELADQAVRSTPLAWKTQLAALAITPAPRHAFAKRALDIAVALVALLITLPLYPMIILAIRLESKGSAIYRQVRVGLNGRIFVVLKFRSMYDSQQTVDPVYQEIANRWIAGAPVTVPLAEHTGAAPAQAERKPGEERGGRSKPTGPQYKLANDPRITRVGRFLRATSLDELPQFLNVLMGDMSVVGPRPSIPFEVERYAPRAFGRLLVKPGVTGLWQVEGRGHATFQQMIDLDLRYVARNSFWYDIGLILRTIPAVLRRSGAA